jgi:hypothetical protein
MLDYRLHCSRKIVSSAIALALRTLDTESETLV